MRKHGTAEDYDAMNAEEARAIVFYDPWEEPPPVEFPGGVLSPKMEDTIFALALRHGACPGALAMAHLAAVSGAAHKGSRFMPYGYGWTVRPIIWVMLIAELEQWPLDRQGSDPICRRRLESVRLCI